MATSKAAFPDGHFYSPVVDPEEAARDRARIWPESPAVWGIGFNDASHLDLLTGAFPTLVRDFDYPEQPPTGAPEWSFYVKNTEFGWLDARTLFVMLRHIRPRRMIEIGSGFSSLLTADVNRRFLDGALDFTCIEPYPRPFLVAGVPGVARLIQQRVQDAPVALFESLTAGDIAFVDSSHVAKTGSDVNHIFFEILPRLQAGVIVHFHDIFLPLDYPEKWVCELGRSWNEQYLLRALLMESTAFEILFGCSYAAWRHPQLIRRCLRGELIGGGSLWLRRTRGPCSPANGPGAAGA